VNGFHHYPAAIESKKIEMLDWVYSKIETPYGYYFEGYKGMYTIEVIEWLDSKGADFSEIFFCNVIVSNRIDILEWMIQNGKKLKGKLCSSAIKNKNMNILKWLREHDYPWDMKSFDIVLSLHATEGISEFLDYYKENINIQ
jgi:hypothetical protein